MNLARTFAERLALWCLRAVATLVTLAGASVLVSSLATLAAPLPGSLARLFPVHAVRFGAVLAVGGLLALFLASTRAPLFQAERADPATRPGGPATWRWLFALTLLVAPLAMLWQLESLAIFWRDTFKLLGELGPWELKGDLGWSGVILLPLFGILALPTFETLSAVAFAAAFLFLLVLVATRSRVELRSVLGCAAILGASALAALLAEDTTRQVMPTVARMVRETSAGYPDESAQALAALARYHDVTRHAAYVLAWSWIALGAWVPFLVLQALSQVRALALPEPGAASAAPMPYEAMPAARLAPARAVAADGSDRERFYADAARLVDEGGPSGSRGRPIVVVLIVTLALLGLFALISGLGVLAAFSRIVTR